MPSADGLTEGRLRAKGYSVGDIVFAEIKKPRRPRFHRPASDLPALPTPPADRTKGRAALAEALSMVGARRQSRA